MTVSCPYCGWEAAFVYGYVLYPGRPDLERNGYFYCKPCEAWVGCHAGTRKPLGRLANAELRKAKQAAHKAFDTLWRIKMRNGFSKRVARSAAYKWLAGELGIPPKNCHIGMFDVEMCERAREICQAVLDRRSLMLQRVGVTQGGSDADSEGDFGLQVPNARDHGTDGQRRAVG